MSKNNSLLNCTLLVVFIVLPALSFSQTYQFDDNKLSQIKNYKSFKLENGLTIIHLNNKDSTHFFIRTFTNLPNYVAKSHRTLLSIDTELRKFTNFKLPLGWNKKSLKELSIELDKDKNGFFAKCSSENIDTALFFFSKLFQNPVIASDEIEKSKKNILATADSISRLPEDKIDKITKSIIYGKDHPILKKYEAAEINRVTKEDYLEFYERFYKPNNSYVIVIGDIRFDSLKILSDSRLGGWKKKDVPESDYKLIPIKEPKIVFFDTIPSGETNIKILFPFALYPFTFDSEKAELLSLLFQDLLSEKLVDKMALAKSIDARFESDKITGNYQLNVQLNKDSLNEVIQEIIGTISKLKTGKYPSGKLKAAKSQIIEEFRKHNTTNEYISWLIMNTERNNLPKEYYADFIKDVNSIDIGKVQTFAAKYLNYNTALFQIPGRWYKSLNDFITLCKDFRIELYQLDGTIHKVIPKGFNGFSVIDNYIASIGGQQNIKKLKDVSIDFGAVYELADGNEIFVNGRMLHKSNDKYFTERFMIRPKKDTIFIHQQIFNGLVGLDSTKQGKKLLQNKELELLKYKSPFVPEMKYKEWQYKAQLVKADTLNGKYVWAVVIDNPGKQRIIDYYDVDKGLRYRRLVSDAAHFNKRIILYNKYEKEGEKGILYPHLKTIITKEATIKMVIRNVDYKSKINKKLFDIE